MHGRRRLSPLMKDGEIPHNLINFTGQGINMTNDWKFVICLFVFFFTIKVRSEHIITFPGREIEPGGI